MKLQLTATLICTAFISALASPYFDNITNLWAQAQHSNVLTLANQRLVANSNDVAGVLMKASWDFIFAGPVELSNSMNRVLSVGSTIKTPSFTNVFEITKIDIVWLNNYLSCEDPSDRAANIEKATQRGRMPHYIEELKALDDDGYFDNNL